MIEQYHKDASQIHASSELIRQTRAAMRQEEERLKEEEELSAHRRVGKRKAVIFLSVAAAALLLVIVPGAIQGSTTQAEIKMPDKLGQKEEKSLISIESGNSQALKLTETAKMPAEYADAEKIEKAGAVFYILPGEAKDEWEAYVEYKGKNYLLLGSAGGKEEFLEQAAELLDERS